MKSQQISNEFTKWRSNRKTLKEPIPSRLWKMAVKAAEESSPTDVAKACKIPVTKLKKKMDKKLSENKVTFQKLDSMPSAKYSATPIFEITTANGTNIKVYR